MKDHLAVPVMADSLKNYRCKKKVGIQKKKRGVITVRICWCLQLKKRGGSCSKDYDRQVIYIHTLTLYFLNAGSVAEGLKSCWNEEEEEGHKIRGRENLNLREDRR